MFLSGIQPESLIGVEEADATELLRDLLELLLPKLRGQNLLAFPDVYFEAGLDVGNELAELVEDSQIMADQDASVESFGFGNMLFELQFEREAGGLEFLSYNWLEDCCDFHLLSVNWSAI